MVVKFLTVFAVLTAHLPFEDVFIKSCDGLALHGKYYEAVPNAPVIIFFHGYRCSALRDGNGVLLYARRAGYNTLMADLRAHGLCYCVNSEKYEHAVDSFLQKIVGPAR